MDDLIGDYYVMKIEDEFNKYYHHFSGNETLKMQSIKYLDNYKKKLSRSMRQLQRVQEVMNIEPFVDVSAVYVQEYKKIRMRLTKKLVLLWDRYYQ